MPKIQQTVQGIFDRAKLIHRNTTIPVKNSQMASEQEGPGSSGTGEQKEDQEEEKQ